MCARPAFRFLLCLLVLIVPGVAPALADAPTTLYRLQGDYPFQEGCFGMCMCPVLAADMEGRFGLTPAGPSDGFENWTVSDVDWLVESLGVRLTGSGLFRLSRGPDAQQQLILDLSLDDGPVERYDSGVVPAVAAFPRIDAVTSLYGMQCFDRVLHVQAAPAGAGPITFRFWGTVTDVFDGLGALDSSVAPGTSFRGTYTFDPSTPNTAPPVGEGEVGLYHHDRPPAGVRIRAGHFTFRSVPPHPDFDIIVANEFGFAGADEYGFSSRNNQARGLLTGFPIDYLDLDWLATTFVEDPLQSADLPLTPPDLDLLGGGVLTIYGDCTLCAGFVSFFRIEGTLTSLTTPVKMSVDDSALRWEGPDEAEAYDVLQGDLQSLIDAGGDYGAATEGCLANNETSRTLVHTATPAVGEALWFVVRPVATGGNGTWDSYGLAQDGERDEGIQASGRGCP